MCSDIISYSFMFSRRKKSLSTILSVFVQIVPILFMLFGLSLPNDFYIICISNLFSTICTRLDIYIVFFLVFVCVQCYVISLFTPGFSGVRVSRSIVLCVCFVDRCLSFCPFSFGHCVVCPSSNYGFRLSPLVSSSSSYWCLVQVIVVKMFYLFSLDILLSITTVKTINPFSQ